jgi:uncharacterized integral membrane protein
LLKKIRRWLAFLFIIASMLLGFWVYVENSSPVSLTLFGFALEQQPLGLLVIITFVSGVALGLFCNVLATSWMIFKMKRMQKQLRRFEIPGSEKNS